MSILPTSRDCIVCGQENPIGLRVRFTVADGGVTADVIPQDHFQGFRGILHGGIISGLLDDAMWWAVYLGYGTPTLTAELNTRFRRPVPVGKPLRIRAAVTEVKGRRLFVCQAQIVLTAGEIPAAGEVPASDEVLAEATGRFLRAPDDVARQLLADV